MVRPDNRRWQERDRVVVWTSMLIVKVLILLRCLPSLMIFTYLYIIGLFLDCQEKKKHGLICSYVCLRVSIGLVLNIQKDWCVMCVCV